MIDRRSFLARAAAVGVILPLKFEAFAQATSQALPSKDLYDKNEEAYWKELRKLWVIPEGVVYLNNGTVGSSPVPVIKAVMDGFNETEKMMLKGSEEYPIWGYGPEVEFRKPLADFLGCTVDQ